MNKKEELIKKLEESFNELEKAKNLLDDDEELSIWEIENKDKDFSLDESFYSLKNTIKTMKIKIIKEKWN